MKIKMKQLSKRILAMLMILTTIFSVFPSASVLAATSEKATMTFDYCYDSGGSLIRWQHSFTHGGITIGGAGTARTRIYANGDDAYCIQPGVSLHTGNVLTLNASDTWNALSSSQQAAVNLALLYGKQGNAANLSGTDDEKWVATQIILWEIVTGCRKSTGDYACTDTKFYEGMCAGGANSGVSAAYNQISGYMAEHDTIPSFTASSKGAASVQALKWNGNEYTLTIKDTNSVLSNFTFTSSDSNVSVSASGNTLTITSKKALTDTVTLSATKTIPTVSSSAKLAAYGDPTLQDVVTGIENAAAVQAYLKVEIPYGNLKLVKISEDGVVSGIQFNIVGNGYNQTVTTGANGTITAENLTPGTYTVTELTANRYETQTSQTITVNGGETAEIHFSNVLKRGGLKVTKTSEDGLVEGLSFHLYGTSLSGIAVDEYAVTDASGVATFSNILISGGEPYTLEEVDTAVRYVVPASQKVAINWKEVTSATFTNILKKFRVTVTKVDVETGQANGVGDAQGDASLAGATYGIYDGDTLIDTYTTDTNGQFTTSYYVCGDNWAIREIDPSEGYLLDETAHHVGAEAGNYTIELNTTANTVTEQVIKGRISIIKHSDDGSTQIETPEVGAVFEIYLKNAGSYENAKESERDRLTCDEYGYAETKDLPYGIYTVHQTEGLEGAEFMSDFEVYISTNGTIYRYLINNAPFKSYIKVVKTDAETGNTIPLAGAGFQIYDSAGNLVTMKYTYPEVTTIDTFYTGSNGYLITPEILDYGNYTLVEVQAPYGYTLDSTPVPFTVSAEHSTAESEITVVTVTMKDMPQKGRITVNKTGESFSSVMVSGSGIADKEGNLAEDENIYTPVYNVCGMAGATYEIIAAEDIVTPDGTIRATAGDVVDTVTTGEDGTAVSAELYLGRYRIVETTAPEGMVLNSEAQEVELTYAGQEIAVTEMNTAFYNERQKVLVDLSKELEQDEIFGIGNTGEIQNVSFGLYATEDIRAADGTVIPADGLLEIKFCNSDGTIAFTSDLPLGSYYVKEVSTDQHYILSEEKYPVTFSYQGQDTALVNIHVNDGNVIENEMIRGSISGLKVDEDNEPLADAVIGLFEIGTEEFTEENARLLSHSDEHGAFAFENVPFGDYIVREVKAPTGYVLNEAIHYISVTFDEQVIEVKLINRLMTGSVRLTKVDAGYPTNKLTGATFALYQDTDGDEIFTQETDTYLGELPEISTGIYQMDELLYGGYFVKEVTAPEGFLLDENAYSFSISEDGIIVDVENEAGVGFTNQPITGTLELTKKDVSDGKLLPNAGFRIKDKDGNIVATGTTDENGAAAFTLRYGKYTYQEYAAPEGYQIDESEFPFEVKENGQIIKAEMTNEKKPVETVTTPKTGDDSHVGIWIVLTAVAGLGAAAFGIISMKSRKKKQED